MKIPNPPIPDSPRIRKAEMGNRGWMSRRDVIKQLLNSRESEGEGIIVESRADMNQVKILCRKQNLRTVERKIGAEGWALFIFSKE